MVATSGGIVLRHVRGPTCPHHPAATSACRRDRSTTWTASSQIEASFLSWSREPHHTSIGDPRLSLSQPLDERHPVVERRSDIGMDDLCSSGRPHEDARPAPTLGLSTRRALTHCRDPVLPGSPSSSTRSPRLGLLTGLFRTGPDSQHPRA